MKIKLKVRYTEECENMTIKTMDCYLYKRLSGIIYQCASSRLFIPRGDNVFSLCIK